VVAGPRPDQLLTPGERVDEYPYSGMGSWHDPGTGPGEVTWGTDQWNSPVVLAYTNTATAALEAATGWKSTAGGRRVRTHLGWRVGVEMGGVTATVSIRASDETGAQTEVVEGTLPAWATRVRLEVSFTRDAGAFRSNDGIQITRAGLWQYVPGQRAAVVRATGEPGHTANAYWLRPTTRYWKTVNGVDYFVTTGMGEAGTWTYVYRLLKVSGLGESTAVTAEDKGLPGHDTQYGGFVDPGFGTQYGYFTGFLGGHALFQHLDSQPAVGMRIAPLDAEGQPGHPFGGWDLSQNWGWVLSTETVAANRSLLVAFDATSKAHVAALFDFNPSTTG
jgi:hypothetical protein